MKQRSDIDGLRGVAVALVVAYHANIAAIAGGYVGVDVFFVISGYLMARLTVAQFEAGTFSAAEFYERRVRRIVPALFVTVIAALAVGYRLLDESALWLLTGSVLSLVAGASNLFFWKRIDYFAAHAPEQPLLHTWSLSVEEQFYLLLPLAGLIAWRVSRRTRVTMLIVVLVASLALSVGLTGGHAAAAFYLLPVRVWELLLGCGLAILPAPRTGRSSTTTWMFALGMALILVAATGLTPQTPYPGVAALLPCLGAAAIVWAGAAEPAGGGIARLLANAPLIWLGRISYSLYLWHWPVFTFLRYRVGRELDLRETTFAALLSIVLAYLSWRLVEQPVRKRAILPSRRALWLATAGCAVIVVAAALIVRATAGSPLRGAQAAGSPDIARTTAACHQGPQREVVADKLCVFGESREGVPPILVWGDSHANALIPALEALSAESGAQVLQASYSNCPPLLDTRVARAPGNAECREFNDLILREIDARGIRRVLLAAYWSNYLGIRAESPLSRALDIYSGPDDLLGGSSQRNHELFEAAFARTMDALEKRHVDVWVVGQVPVQRGFVPNLLAHARETGVVPETIGVPADIDTSHREPVNAILRRRVDASHFLDPAPVLCGSGICRVTQDDHALYIDDNHLSRAGANELRGVLRQVFQ